MAIGGSASQELTIHSSEPTDFELVLRPDRISSDAFGVEGPAVFRGARDAKVRVRFAPRSPGPVRADIDVVTSTSAATVRLIGGGVSSGPRITWSGNAASFLPGLAPNCWGTIKGSGLATTTREWSREDFRGDQLPLELSGTAVIINGKRSALAYISPTQINFLGPAAVGGSNDTNRALVEATVETPFGRSNPSVVYMDDRAPAFFLWKSDAHYPASTTPQGQFIGPPGLLGHGVPTRAASPGDVLVLYTTGLGGTTPAYPDGALIRTPAELTTLPYITLFKDSVSANVHIWHALLTGPGLYQLAITVPEIADGEYFINMAVNDKRLDQDVRILVRRKE